MRRLIILNILLIFRTLIRVMVRNTHQNDHGKVKFRISANPCQHIFLALLITRQNMEKLELLLHYEFFHFFHMGFPLSSSLRLKYLFMSKHFKLFQSSFSLCTVEGENSNNIFPRIFHHTFEMCA